ncbi:hypothetical protein NDA01_24725 [Trichocoleus desertorum AS-A10]|uniref:hypothetical protein n=1 Tax=Trichocoleus desertorum TaxID=1481672 RepID=UPI00329883B8
MSKILALQPSKTKVSSRTICTTIPRNTPLPTFSLFQEVQIGPDVSVVVVGIEYCSRARSVAIFENSNSQGWWVHLDWRFTEDTKRNRGRADYMGYIWSEGRLLRAAKDYQRSLETKAAEPELILIAS